jgi:deazaflavin-dependent oxidoreductase (nitroreductase family)
MTHPLRGRWPSVALVLLATVGLAATAAEVPVDELLRTVKHQGECRITTTGRKTGTPHTVTVWFAVADDRVLLSTLDASRDWVRNALANPEVTLEFDELTLTGRLRDVTGTDLDGRARELLRKKYTIARVAGWFGRGPERTFAVEHLAPAS